ncbi:hypothetical protein AiwAL_07365 [Acidiphilium sp. AL]|uniref:hypothetical protein n=1 Tax=Acidiphilium sp. AL TaxID=2871704 RepID=UPI0038D0777E|nr:hypothetical protein [Acidiphilium sp. AL]
MDAIFAPQGVIIARDFTIYAARNKATPLASWINRLLATKPARVVAIAVANKLARIAWTLIHSGQKFLAAKACVPVTGAAA